MDLNRLRIRGLETAVHMALIREVYILPLLFALCFVQKTFTLSLVGLVFGSVIGLFYKFPDK